MASFPYVSKDVIEDPDVREIYVVSHELQLSAVRILLVVLAHPLDKLQIFFIGEQSIITEELLPHDLAGITLAIEDVVVELESGPPIQFQHECGEPFFFDQVLEDAVFEGKELVGTVSGLTHADHRGFSDHPFQRLQIVQAAVRFGGPQRIRTEVKRADYGIIVKICLGGQTDFFIFW